MQPLVSIIIPTFNRAHLIGQTLDSIRSQSFENWECLVVDDGSTDKTAALVQAYEEKDRRFRYIKRPQDRPKGANACRNYGFELSQGDFINWFDSDDIMLYNKLELQIKVLSAYHESPYCICQTEWVDKTTNSSLGLRANSIASNNRFEDYVLNRIFWSILAPLWRRSFVIDHDLHFDESLHQSQEYDFHIKALAINDNYLAINDTLVIMYRHEDNLSNSIYADDAKLISNLKVKRMVFDSYSSFLSAKGKLKLHEAISLMLKQIMILKNFRIAQLYLKTLIWSLKYLKLPFYRKVYFVIKLWLAYVSYYIFGVGYRLLTPLKIKSVE